MTPPDPQRVEAAARTLFDATFGTPYALSVERAQTLARAAIAAADAVQPPQRDEVPKPAWMQCRDEQCRSRRRCEADPFPCSAALATTTDAAGGGNG